MNPTTRADIFFTTVCCLLVLFFQFPSSVRSVAAPPPPSFMTPYGTYVSSYDHMDVGRLLKNDKLVTAYMRCFLNQGPCTVEGRQVKAYLLPEVIRTVCSKCSPRQKDMARQVLKYIYYTRRSDFDQIMRIYDTDNKYSEIIYFMNENN